MKLSDLDNYEVVKPASGKKPLKLSDLDKYDVVPQGDRTPSSSTAEDPSELESFGRGAAQGASLGFADELTGAAYSVPDLLDVLTGGNKSFSDVGNTYRKERDESRHNYEEAERVNPKSFIGGSLVGALAPGVLSAGTGTAAATGLGALGRAIGTGAAYGGVSALGNSKADLTQGDVGGAAADTAKGVATGAITGGVLSGAAQGIKGLGGLAAKTKPGSEIAEAYGMGKEGYNLLDKNTIKRIEDVERNSTANDIANKLFRGDSSLKGQIGKQFSSIKEQYANKNIDLKTSIEKIQNLINTLDDKIPEEAADKAKLSTLLSNFMDVKASKFTPAQTIETVLPSTESTLGKTAAEKNAIAKFFGGEMDNAIIEPLDERYVSLQVPGTDKIGIYDKVKGTVAKLTAKELEGEPNEAGLAALDNTVSDKNAVDKFTGGSANNASISLGDKYSVVRIPGTNKIAILDKAKGTLTNLSEDVPQTIDQKIIPGQAGEEYTADQLNSLPAERALTLKRGFQNSSGFQKGSASQQGEYVAGQAASELGNAAEQQVPGLDKANEDFHTLQEKVLSPLGLKNADDVDAIKKLKNIIWNQNAETKIGSDTRSKLEEPLQQLEKLNPELAAEIRDKIGSVSRKINIARKAGNEPFPTAGNPLKTIEGLGLTAANVAGTVAAKAGKVLSDMPKEQLTQLGGYFTTNGGQLGQKLGNILTEAANRDEIGRNALIFTLMQNPGYRQMIHKKMGFQD